MLDAKYTLFSYVANNNQKISSLLKALLIKTCRAYVFSQGRVYSEFEEMSFDYLNSNDYGFGTLQIEFVFANGVTESPYPDFYTKCFIIRTDNDLSIKPIKIGTQKRYSKVDEHGDLVIGISYYFTSEIEIEKIGKCESLLVEGFISLDKPNNVFGVMCQLSKNADSTWSITSSYTYKPRYAKNIKNLLD